MEDGLLLSRVDGFFYDGDGTLWDTESLLYQVYAEMVAERGRVMTEAQYLPIVGQGALAAARILIDQFGFKEEPDAFMEERRRRMHPLLATAPLLPGVSEHLERYRFGKTNVHAALVTSAPEAHAGAILDALALRQRFKVVITAETPGLKGLKPDPSSYLLGAKKLGAMLMRCVAFEDTSHGATSAREAGMIVVGTPHRFSPRHKLEGIAHYVLPEGTTLGDFRLSAIRRWLPH